MDISIGSTEIYCPCCKKVRTKTAFFPSLTKSKEFLPYCKECIKEKYKTATENTGSQDAALWSICMELGLPLKHEVHSVTVEQIINISKQGGRKPDLFALYYNNLRDIGVKFNGNYDSDMHISDFIEVGDVKAKEDKMDFEKKLKTWCKTWGKDYEIEDYEMLDEYFTNYTAVILDMDTAMTLRYRDLCKAELRKYNGDESKEVTDEILKLMKLLKIDQFQDNKQSDTEKFIDRWAWRIENTKPCECEDLEKYKDYAGNESMWKDILRVVKNAVAHSREYPELQKD